MKWLVPPGTGTVTAFEFLNGRIRKVKESSLEHRFSQGWITCNGLVIQATHPVNAGDELELNWPYQEDAHHFPEDIPLEIIAREKDFLILNKPAGMAVHKGLGNYYGTLINALCFLLKDEPGFDPNKCLPHRLDKATSGLMLVVTDASRFGYFQQCFIDGLIRRSYTAIVEGKPIPEEGTIRNFIGRVPGDPYLISASEGEFGKEAITSYRTLETGNGFSLVQAELHTGRTHQLRIHMAGLGCPIWGDIRYGSQQSAPRMMLHAHRLQLEERYWEQPAPFSLAVTFQAGGFPNLG